MLSAEPAQMEDASAQLSPTSTARIKSSYTSTKDEDDYEVELQEIFDEDEEKPTLDASSRDSEVSSADCDETIGVPKRERVPSPNPEDEVPVEDVEIQPAYASHKPPTVELDPTPEPEPEPEPLVIELAEPRAPPPPDDNETLSWAFFLRNFVIHCSAQGFPRALESPTQLRKMLWTMFTLCSIAACAYQSTILAMEYLTYPTALNINYRLRRALTFPTVTVCNANKFRVSDLQQHDEIEHLSMFELITHKTMADIEAQISEATQNAVTNPTAQLCTLKHKQTQLNLAAEGFKLKLHSPNPNDARQLFYFSNSGAVISRVQGFCLTASDQLDRAPVSVGHCDGGNIKWLMPQSVSPVYNAFGFAVVPDTSRGIVNTTFSLAVVDPDQPNQPFVKTCLPSVSLTELMECRTYGGEVCQLPFQDEHKRWHQDCTEVAQKDYDGDGPWCATETDGSGKARRQDACNIEICRIEQSCPTQFPDVYPYEYTLGDMPDRFQSGGARQRRGAGLADGDPVASPINPNVGMSCADYVYNPATFKYVQSGEELCVFPSGPLGTPKTMAEAAAISNYIACDGSAMRHGGEDERAELCGRVNHQDSNIKCPADMFECDDNRLNCIPVKLRCDGLINCDDGSDELKQFCDPEAGKFACATYNKLIKTDQVCDSIIDCHRDQSDEVGIACDTKYNGASSDNASLLACQDPTSKDWKAVAKWRLCDGAVDCLNGADEAPCWKNSLDQWVDPFEELNLKYDKFLEVVAENPNQLKYYKMATRDTIVQSGHSLEQMMVQCSFQTQACNFTKDFREVISQDYGRCYQFEFDEPVVNGGKAYGLEFLLNVESYEYTGILTSDLGFVVFISPQGSSGYLDPLTALPVFPGMQSNIELRQEETWRLKEPHGQCQDYGTDELPFKSRRECLFHCLQVAKLGRCRCSDDVTFSDKLCRYNETDRQYCVDTVEQDFDSGTDCLCPEECHSVSVAMKLEQSFWPSVNAVANVLIQAYRTVTEEPGLTYILETIQLFLNESTRTQALEKIRTNYAKLNIYYGDLMVIEMESSSSFSFEALISGIGGLLGLWIGLSMLSIVEFMDLIFDAYGLYNLKAKQAFLIRRQEDQAAEARKAERNRRRKRKKSNKIAPMSRPQSLKPIAPSTDDLSPRTSPVTRESVLLITPLPTKNGSSKGSF